MNSFLKKLIPPIFLELRGRFRAPRMEFVQNGWQLPRSDYNEELLVNKQIKKFRRLVAEAKTESTDHNALEYHELNCAQVAALIALQGKKHVRILDFGGALGVYHHFIKKVLPDSVELEYHISEVGKICEVGKRFSPEVEFHADTIPTGRFDLIIISGTLQYIQDWRGGLEKLSNCDFLYLPRTPVTEGWGFTVKDYFAGVSKPIVFEVRNRTGLEDFVISLEFEKLTEFVLPSFPPVKNAPSKISYSNCLFRKIRPGNPL